MIRSKAVLLSSLNFEGALRNLKSLFSFFTSAIYLYSIVIIPINDHLSRFKNSICATFFLDTYSNGRSHFFLFFCFFRFPHHHQLMTCWLLDLKVCALNHDRSFVPTYNCVWKKLKKQYHYDEKKTFSV